jgi:virginiamycin B lyase
VGEQLESADLRTRAPKRRRAVIASAIAVLVVAAAISVLNNDSAPETTVASRDHAHPSLTVTSGDDNDGQGEDDGETTSSTHHHHPTTTTSTTDDTPVIPTPPTVTTLPVHPPTTLLPHDNRLTEWPTDGDSDAGGLVADLHGNVWYTVWPDVVGRINAATGHRTVFHTPTPNSSPDDIVVGPDGALWFVEQSVQRIGRIDGDGDITEFSTGDLWPFRLTVGSDGALWFIANHSWANDHPLGQLGRLTVNGEFTYYALGSELQSIATGPDGYLWISDIPMDHPPYAASIYRVRNDATIVSTYVIPPPNADEVGVIWDVTPGPDDAMWFTYGLSSSGSIGRMTTSGDYELFDNDGLWPTFLAWVGDELWFNGRNVDKIGKRSLTGHLTTMPADSPDKIAAGPDGNVWFVEGFPTNAIARYRL